MKIIGLDKWQGTYAEIGQTNPLRWQNLKLVGEQTYEPVSHKWKCKDFMNEVVTSYHTKRDFAIYGFSVKHSTFFDELQNELPMLLHNVLPGFDSNMKIVNKYLKKRVLEPALKQINEHTDITATYEQHKKGRTITGFSFKFKQKKKTEPETPKNSDSSQRIEKPSQIPANIVKQPENANLSDLQHRASKITGLIMSNRLSDRFKQGDESIMQMMARIQSEITTDSIAEQWQSKLEEFGVVF